MSPGKLRIETLLMGFGSWQAGQGKLCALGSIPSLLSQDSSHMKRGKILLQQIQKYEMILGSAAEPQIFSHLVEIRVYGNFFSVVLLKIRV